MRHDFTWLRTQALLAHAREAGYRSRWPTRRSRCSIARATRWCCTTTCCRRIEWLSGRYRLFAVSNGNADLRAIGLAQYFERSLAARDAGALKPDPRIFTMLLDAAGVPAQGSGACRRRSGSRRRGRAARRHPAGLAQSARLGVAGRTAARRNTPSPRWPNSWRCLALAAESWSPVAPGLFVVLLLRHLLAQLDPLRQLVQVLLLLPALLAQRAAVVRVVARLEALRVARSRGLLARDRSSTTSSVGSTSARMRSAAPSVSSAWRSPSSVHSQVTLPRSSLPRRPGSSVSGPRVRRLAGVVLSPGLPAMSLLHGVGTCADVTA